jgi:signal transduction histidine kinase
MRCKDIERLIIDSSDEDLSAEELSAIEKHVASCALCVRFRDDLEKIRMGIKVMPQPVLPPALAQKTRLRCQAEISQQPAAAKKIAKLIPSDPIPKYVWAVLLPLILLTVFVIVPVFKEIRLDQTLTFTSVVALTIIIQNAVMLLFAPILIRRRHSKKQNIRGIPMNANAT